MKRVIKHIKTSSAAAVAVLSLVCTNQAKAIVLTFEGVGDLAPVGNYYNGGGGGNLGITFGSAALAIVDADAGGSGNFGGEPSASTVLFFLDSNAATMNVPAGFTTGFSFFYSAINNPGFVNVYDGLNGTGNILTTLNLPVTASDGGDPNGQFSPFVPFGVNFSGTALSVDFGGTANQIGFDDVTLGSSTPGNVPDGGATLSLLGLAMSGLVMIKRKFRS